jgi:hypothetical protein
MTLFNRMKLNRDATRITQYFYIKLYASLLLTCLCAFQISAQQNSDIWVGKLNLWEKDPISELVQITDTDSYTNQPYFFDNSHLFYTQAMNVEAGESQIDVWVFDFKLGTGKNVTQSTFSEYSPTPLPYDAGMSVIRVNEEGKQELWEIDPQGKAIKNIVPEVEPVGYQVWMNNKELLLFVLGEPHTLQRVDSAKANAVPQIVDSNIGASLFQFEKTDWFLYTNKTDGNYLNAYNIKSKKVIQVASMPKNSEYFSVSPIGHVITSDGNTLWQRKFMLKGEKIKAMDKWLPIKMSQGECEKGVSRTAVSPDTSMIALVCPRQ